jgi:hypothetical protein
MMDKSTSSSHRQFGLGVDSAPVEGPLGGGEWIFEDRTLALWKNTGQYVVTKERESKDMRDSQ